ncbi:MAG: glycosyltransferase family 4 protein [Verrucomicrobiota bacterium]|jgi:glycosyltransferase involved in cell wall biosynthesis
MRITLINQTFYPDVVSSGQHLKDLAVRLAECGHDVTVVASRRAYDSPQKLFPKRETWLGIKIYRVANTGFGKRSKLTRIVDFATFILSCCWRLCWLPRQDLVVALTSPPIISFIGALFARIRGGRFCYWVMDLNPDEAVAAGWLNPNSFTTKFLERCSRFSLGTASRIVVLDEFMRDRILNKGILEEKIAVVPPWSHDSDVRFDPVGRSSFRKAHGLEDKFVIMYAGNHSPCHPLDTILGAAEKLSGRPDIAFCFVGGGSEFARVKKFAQEHRLASVVCLPYQPIDQLAGSLSAADLHVVVMGNPFVGMVHPCKIYNIMRVGAPLLYVGPKPSHISRILDKVDHEMCWATANHGESDLVVQHILRIKDMSSKPPRSGSVAVAERFSTGQLLPGLVKVLENAGTRN